MADPDSHYFGKLDSSEKLDPDPH
jgi:hypothetical protein